MRPPAARAVVGPSAIVGLSTHTREQILDARTEPITYVAVGPIFGSRTKDTGYNAVGLELVRVAAGVIGGVPIVAIGGITLDRAAAAGCTPVGSVNEAVKDADVVITMLPAGPHVLKVYAEQVIGAAPTSALLLDCSTIDVDTARKVAGLAKDAGYAFADAPVSGGTMAADAGTLAFMVGCDEPREHEDPAGTDNKIVVPAPNLAAAHLDNA